MQRAVFRNELALQTRVCADQLPEEFSYRRAIGLQRRSTSSVLAQKSGQTNFHGHATTSDGTDGTRDVQQSTDLPRSTLHDDRDFADLPVKNPVGTEHRVAVFQAHQHVHPPRFHRLANVGRRGIRVGVGM